MNGYTVRKISDLAAVYGEDLVKRIVSSFSCRHNDEVDDFLILSALDFAKRRISVTDLVFDNESGLCVGYFTLAVKPLKIPACELSATQRKRCGICGFRRHIAICLCGHGRCLIVVVVRRARPLTRRRRLWYHSNCSRGRNPLNPRDAPWIAGGCSV